MSFAKKHHQWIIKEFKPYIGDIVTEVRAGIGNFSELLLRSGVKLLLAFELSENMYPVRKRSRGVTVQWINYVKT